MTSLFNSAAVNISPNSSSSTSGNGAGEKNRLCQQVKSALQSLVNDLEEIDFQESHQLRDRITEIIKLTTVADQQEKVEQQTFAALAEKLRLAPDNETLLDTTVREVQQLLDADRIVLYTFRSDKEGIVVAEALREGFTPAIGEKLPSLCFGLSNAMSYQRAKVVEIADVEQADLSPYQLQLMERFQVSSSLAVPVLLPERVWGLIVVQQCLKPRHWQDSEIRLLERVSTELGVQLQTEAVREQLQEQLNAESAMTKVIDKLRQPFDLKALFTTATLEILVL